MRAEHLIGGEWTGDQLGHSIAVTHPDTDQLIVRVPTGVGVAGTLRRSRHPGSSHGGGRRVMHRQPAADHARWGPVMQPVSLRRRMRVPTTLIFHRPLPTESPP